MVERCPCKAEVSGSRPLISNKTSREFKKKARSLFFHNLLCLIFLVVFFLKKKTTKKKTSRRCGTPKKTTNGFPRKAKKMYPVPCTPYVFLSGRFIFLSFYLFTESFLWVKSFRGKFGEASP